MTPFNYLYFLVTNDKLKIYEYCLKNAVYIFVISMRAGVTEVWVQPRRYLAAHA